VLWPVVPATVLVSFVVFVTVWSLLMVPLLMVPFLVAKAPTHGKEADCCERNLEFRHGILLFRS
jgi:hypothetical protein